MLIVYHPMWIDICYMLGILILRKDILHVVIDITFSYMHLNELISHNGKSFTIHNKNLCKVRLVINLVDWYTCFPHRYVMLTHTYTKPLRSPFLNLIQRITYKGKVADWVTLHVLPYNLPGSFLHSSKTHYTSLCTLLC